MRIKFDLLKSARQGLVQVQRQVNKNGKVFNQHFWVKPSDVKSTDVVLSKPDDTKTKASSVQIPAEKKVMVELLSKHSRDDLMSHAKNNGLTWNENPNAGINWMRASMAIQNDIKSNPDAWNDSAIGSKVQRKDKPVEDKKEPAITIKKTSDEAKKMVKELVSSMGRDKLMELAKDKGIAWKEHSSDKINWMRASMAISSALTENPDIMSEATQKVELKSAQERVKQLEDLVSQVTNPTAQQVAQQKAKVDLLQGLTTDFKSSREQKVFGDALSKATPAQFMRARTLGMCAGDDTAAEYLERLYKSYVDTMGNTIPHKYDKNIDDDPLRNKLQGVVNKQVVGVVKSSLSNARKRSTQFTFKQKLLEPWVDPNTTLTEQDVIELKKEQGQSLSSKRQRMMTEIDGSHQLMKKTLDKLASSKEYGDLATEYRGILDEYIKLTKADSFLQTITHGDGKAKSASSLISGISYQYTVAKERVLQQSRMVMDQTRLVSELEKEIKSGESDPNSKYYINPNWNKGTQDKQISSNEQVLQSHNSSLERYRRNLKDAESNRDYYEELLDDYEQDASDLVKAVEVREKLYDPKFTDLNVNLWHMKAMGTQLAYQYQIKKDFVSNYPILSKENIDKLEKGDQESLANLSLYAGMFKPALAKKGDAKDVIMEKYRERQELLATYGGVTSSQNVVGNYTEDNEIKCKVSKASDKIVAQITQNIERDWDKRAHGTMKYKIKGIYEVSGLAVEKQFDEIKKAHTSRAATQVSSTAQGQGKNATSDLFYHGTGAMATSLILGHSGEFRVGKAKVGRMLGDGIYLADKSSKSAQYISDSGYSRHGIKGSLMVVEASLGTTTGRSDMRNWSSYDTIFGGKQHGLLNNEWCVHNPKAVIPRYLVEMEIV